MPQSRRTTDHFANLVDHDLLIEIKVKLADLQTDVKQMKDDQAKRIDSLEEEKASKSAVDDHEHRLRFLERYAWGAIAILGLINFVGFGGIIYFLQQN